MSLRDLSRRSGVPHTTLGDLLNPRRFSLPRLEVVIAVVRACGADDMQVLTWERSWRELHAADSGSPAAIQPDIRRPVIVPAQLPIGLSDFTGRATEIAALGAICDGIGGNPGVPRLVAVTGPGGIGKTALAVHVAHRMRNEYPDGQLYADLRGASGAPVAPVQILHRFVHALGMDVASIPQDEDAASAVYRSLMAERRVLVVLDDTAGAAQVHPLLPAGSRCTVIVTSRDRLASLDGAERISLAPLEPNEAAELFLNIFGRTVPSDGSIEEILNACGGVPLALRTAAASLIAEPTWPLGVFADPLAEGVMRPRSGESAAMLKCW